MDKSTIERVVQEQGHTPRFQRVSQHEERLFAINGRVGQRSLGYLSAAKRMTEEQFEARIRAAFERSARYF